MYLERFRDSEILSGLAEKIKKYRFDRAINFMEVCGTHTVQIHRYGLKDVLPPNVRHISGPGCPVCVTPQRYIDLACAYADEGFLIVTFGDMLRVPGTRSSLEKKKAEGGKVEVVYSSRDAVLLAEKNRDEKILFLAIGFETTAPGIAATIREARERNLKNFWVLPGNKLVPPALEALLTSDVKIDGFLLPGHVSTIIGRKAYLFLEGRIPSVIAGFEPVDILYGIDILLGLIKDGRCEVLNAYGRAVREEGNEPAQEIMYSVFEVCDSEWRGLGKIEHSGLSLKDEWKDFDVTERFPVDIPEPVEHPGCRCGDVLQGKLTPPECPLFGKACTPENPVGPCMVSTEGSCSAYYKYG